MSYCSREKGLMGVLGVCFAEITADETHGSCALSAWRFLHVGGVLILAHKISWSYWHSSLCLCVSHPEGSHQWELSQCLPGEMSWPGDCWFKEIFAKFFLPLCASKRLSNTSHDENVTMVCRNPGFSLCLCHGLYRMLSKPHRPNCSAMTTSCFILCAGAASHCSAQS